LAAGTETSISYQSRAGFGATGRERKAPPRETSKEVIVKIVMIALAVSIAAISAASADTCVTKAIDKNGKPLVGAAKTSFMDKCKKDARTECEAKAVDKNGKPLVGAAKTSSTKKCVDDATGAM
jgi:hypothetical protein